LVYFAALRRVGGDRQLAEDVAQEVFSDMARKASSLRHREVLAGWLYTGTKFAAAEAVRGEKRRQAREHEAESMKQLHSSPATDWEQLRPVIDNAMDELSEQDREAILLRFFEDRPFAEVGASLAMSADAARMRTGRALDKLQDALVRRGLASTSAALTMAITGQSGMAAPMGLTGRIVSGVFTKGATSSTALLSGWKTAVCAGAGALALGFVALKGITWDKADSPPVNAVEAVPVSVSESLVSQVPVGAPTKATPDETPDRTALPSEPDGLSSFSAVQNRLLKALWDIQRSAPLTPGTHWGIRMGPKFYESDANQADLFLLQSDGWVAIGPKKGVIYLTPMGIAFCRAHSKELDALRPGPPG
jgi:RNA polymerase sigma factor (sigma-70 family)